MKKPKRENEKLLDQKRNLQHAKRTTLLACLFYLKLVKIMFDAFLDVVQKKRKEKE